MRYAELMPDIPAPMMTTSKSGASVMLLAEVELEGLNSVRFNRRLESRPPSCEQVRPTTSLCKQHVNHQTSPNGKWWSRKGPGTTRIKSESERQIAARSWSPGNRLYLAGIVLLHQTQDVKYLTLLGFWGKGMDSALDEAELSSLSLSLESWGVVWWSRCRGSSGPCRQPGHQKHL